MEALWQGFRMYDVGGKPLVELRACMLIVQLVPVKGGEIKSMYIDSL